MAPDNQADRVEIRGLEMLLFCGVLEEEQARRQPFSFDLDLYLDLSEAGSTDDLDNTANYGALIEVLTATLANERFRLLERLASRSAEIALDDPIVESVTVNVKKLRPPVAAHLASTGVQIHRSRPKLKTP